MEAEGQIDMLALHRKEVSMTQERKKDSQDTGRFAELMMDVDGATTL